MAARTRSWQDDNFVTWANFPSPLVYSDISRHFPPGAGARGVVFPLWLAKPSSVFKAVFALAGPCGHVSRTCSLDSQPCDTKIGKFLDRLLNYSSRLVLKYHTWGFLIQTPRSSITIISLPTLNLRNTLSVTSAHAIRYQFPEYSARVKQRPSAEEITAFLR